MVQPELATTGSKRFTNLYLNHITKLMTEECLLKSSVRILKNPKVKTPNKGNHQKLSDNKFLTFGLIAYNRTHLIMII